MGRALGLHPGPWHRPRARSLTDTSLGGFFSVTALIVILMLSRAGVRRLLASSGSAA
jgi:hypothetical protein